MKRIVRTPEAPGSEQCFSHTMVVTGSPVSRTRESSHVERRAAEGDSGKHEVFESSLKAAFISRSLSDMLSLLPRSLKSILFCPKICDECVI